MKFSGFAYRVIERIKKHPTGELTGVSRGV